MRRHTVDGLPNVPLPDGYSTRWYQPGDIETWVDVHREAEPWLDVTHDTFRAQFHDDEPALAKRMCFLLDASGKAVATATAWYDDAFNVSTNGRVHWVAMVRDLQGKGLAKPLLSIVCHRHVELGATQLYLFTASNRVPAINLYLKFGFVPKCQNDEERTAWEALRSKVRYPLPDQLT